MVEKFYSECGSEPVSGQVDPQQVWQSDEGSVPDGSQPTHAEIERLQRVRRNVLGLFREQVIREIQIDESWHRTQGIGINVENLAGAHVEVS